MLKHICGQCREKFRTETAYLKHNCDSEVAPQKIGATPLKLKAVSLLEKKIFTAVQLARAKKQYDA